MRCLVLSQVGRGGSYCKATGRVTRHGPSPPTVERCALLRENTDNTTAAECLRVHLALNLERIERKQNLYKYTIS